MRKIELLQVGSTEIKENFSVYSAGIYFKKLTLSEAEQLTSPITTIFAATWTLPTVPVEVSGVSFENAAFSEVASIPELNLQGGSYFFSFTDQTLYLTLFDYENFIVNDDIAIGRTIGFLNQAQLVNINGNNYPLNTFLGAVSYEPRLNSVSVSNQLNDQKNGLFVFSNLEVSIKNNDGIYDTLIDDITGNKAVYLIATLSDSKEEEIETGFQYKLAAEASDFEIKRSGIVETVDYSDPDNPVIIAIDERSNWTQKIGENLLTVVEFPDLPDKYISKRKPIAIGEINGIKAIPLRDDSVAGDFDYLICDTSVGDIASISGVYFDGQLDPGAGTEDIDRFLLVSEYSVDVATGIITISNCVKGDVYIYGIFTTMSETVEIILFLLSTYAGLAYISKNFNIEEVEQIRALNILTHVYVTENGKVLSTVIEKLCSDILSDLYPQGDVLTIRQSNLERPPVEEIPNYQIIQNPPPWNTNRTDTIKTISVGYSYDYRLKLYNTYYNDSFEQEAIAANLKADDIEFETNLTVQSDVPTIYDPYYTRFINIPRTVSFDRQIPFMASLGDFVIFPVIRKVDFIEKTIFTNGIYKITEISEESDSITAVYFSDSREVDLIVEWSPSPVLIYEWSADANITILEAN